MNSSSIKLTKGIFFFALAGLPFTGISQGENLVENGSFESVAPKMKKLGQIDFASPWISPTAVKADLFLGDTKLPSIGINNNPYGTEEPAEGKNFAGFVAYSFGDKVPRSYLMGKLSTPMKKGMRYCISYNVVLAEGSKYACNEIGINISKKGFGTDTKASIIDKATILIDENKILNATYGWQKICGSYTADGGEKFITIGNFASNEATRNEPNKKSKDFRGTQVIAAYYYIDDISVQLMDEEVTCDCGIDDGGLSKMSSLVYSKQVEFTDKMTPTQKIENQAAFFAFGKDVLTSQATAALDFVVTQLNANPKLILTVIGHSDKAEDDIALKLPKFADSDKKRVDVVYKYLISKGIDATRLKVEAKGNTQMSTEIMATDDEELKQAKNRSVTFKVN